MCAGLSQSKRAARTPLSTLRVKSARRAQVRRQLAAAARVERLLRGRERHARREPRHEAIAAGEPPAGGAERPPLGGEVLLEAVDLRAPEVGAPRGVGAAEARLRVAVAVRLLQRALADAERGRERRPALTRVGGRRGALDLRRRGGHLGGTSGALRLGARGGGVPTAARRERLLGTAVGLPLLVRREAL